MKKNVEIIISVRVVGNRCPIPQKTFVKKMEYQRDESTQILFRDYFILLCYRFYNTPLGLNEAGLILYFIFLATFVRRSVKFCRDF